MQIWLQWSLFGRTSPSRVTQSVVRGSPNVAFVVGCPSASDQSCVKEIRCHRYCWSRPFDDWSSVFIHDRYSFCTQCACPQGRQGEGVVGEWWGPVHIACLGVKLNEVRPSSSPQWSRRNLNNQPFISQLSKHVSVCHHGCYWFLIWVDQIGNVL